MDTEKLTSDLEVVLERCASVLNQEIEKARKAVADLNAEKAKAQAALTKLATERKEAQAQLDAAMNNLGRASTLAGLNHEITTAKAELKKLNIEKAALEVSIVGLAKERTDAERQLLALRNEAHGWVTARSESEAAMAGLRRQLASIQLGKQQ
jgi:predicted  nucleic acid-binding Zn-ribbon protein